MDNLFFIFSKIVWGMLSPANLLIWLLVLATIFLWLNRIKVARTLLLVLSALTLMLMAYPFGDMLMSPLEQRFSRPDVLPGKISGIIVLGGGEKVKLSIARHYAELGEGGDRFLAAAVLAKHYPQVPVLYTGGSGLLLFQEPGKQGWIARQLLTAVGIPATRLIIESRSRNSFENFVMIRPLLPNPQGKYILVTSAYHMPRAVGLARSQHIDVIPYPVDYRSTPPSYRQWDFNFLDHLKVLEPAWHEWLGLTAYYISGKINNWFPKPAPADRSLALVTPKTDVQAGIR